MKSLIVSLAFMMIGQLNAEEFWCCSKKHGTFSHEELYEESAEIDSYQHFLNQRQAVDIHSYAYIEGNAKEKIINDQQLILLNIHVPNRSKQIEVLKHDADVVCLRGILSHREGYAYYQMLKDRYAHFYIETSDENISLVALKCRLRDPMFTFYGEGNQVFDFTIIGFEDALGHIYIASLQDENLLESVIGMIERNDTDSKELIPSILSTNLKNIDPEVLQVTSDKHVAESIFLFQPKGSVFGQYTLTKLWSDEQQFLSSLQLISGGNCLSLGNGEILCGGHAEVSASQDTDGNASVGGSVAITETTDSGIQFSAEVSGTVERDSNGNTSAEAKTSVRVDW